MGSKTKDKLTPDGLRFQKMLKELAEKQVRVGFQRGAEKKKHGTDKAKGKKKSNTKKNVDICDIAAWNELGTETIPSRPFLRGSVDDNEERINKYVQSKVKNMMHGSSVRETLEAIGTYQKKLIQKQIREGDFTPNAAATVKKKGSSRPLIDTGRMRQSVNYVIKKKGM